MKLAIHDDGKGKSESWEVSLKVELDDYDTPTMNLLSITGYGQTKQEAIDEFKKDFKASVEHALKLVESLDANNFEEIMVDCFGNELNKG